MRHPSVLLAAAAMVLAAGTGRSAADTVAPAPAPPRPVLSILVEPGLTARDAYAGTIEARYQTDRGFQTLGRMVALNVAVGDVVATGRTLAQLDATALDLALRSSQADAVKAKADLAYAASAEGRATELYSRNVATQAEVEAATQSREGAAAEVQRAQASVDKAKENLAYASLTADIDGVVVATYAQVGQTVSPGQKVVSVARLDVREAVIDLPESAARALAVGTVFSVELQADRAVTTTGKVREIAPEADAATRTRRLRITLDHPADGFRLGATITARISAAPTGAPIAIPVSALLDLDGQARVWVVDGAAKTVRTVPVAIAAQDGTTAVLSGGLTAGTRIVVAGVHSLTEGQPVRLDDGTAP